MNKPSTGNPPIQLQQAAQGKSQLPRSFDHPGILRFVQDFPRALKIAAQRSKAESKLRKAESSQIPSRIKRWSTKIDELERSLPVYKVEIDPLLQKRQMELMANSSSQDFKLAEALEAMTLIAPENLHRFADQNGHIAFGLKLDQLTESHFEDSNIRLTRPPSKEKKEEYPKKESRPSRFSPQPTSIPSEITSTISMMTQCCRAVSTFNQIMGQLVIKLSTTEIKTSERDEAKKLLLKKFSMALSILQGSRSANRRRTFVEVVRKNGNMESVSLAARAIEVTLEIAERDLQLPAKANVQKAIEAEHPELLVKNVNWAPIWKQAGLSKLPELGPWELQGKVSKSSKQMKKAAQPSNRWHLQQM